MLNITSLAEGAVPEGSEVLGDLVMSTCFKPISGRVDQAAGLIFRVQDGGNYHILRANALEANVNFHKYAGGRRALLKEGSAAVRSGEWQELSVEVAGGLLTGELVVEATPQ